MPSIESPENIHSIEEGVLPELQEFERWKTDTFGRETTPEERAQLFELGQSLAKRDPRFNKMLGDALADLLFSNNKSLGLGTEIEKADAYVEALSEYNDRFGLKTDRAA
ncbi:MAG: hypothetical protein WCV82_01585 [Candidatus Paceibacterota bacterium]